MIQALLAVLLGLLAGVLSGLIGIGGGILVVPGLVFAFGMSQHRAQGTTLAMMIPPIGILAAWTYYRQGNVDIRVAGLLCIGFVLGGYLGARVAGTLSDVALTRVFGVVMLVISLRMIFARG